MTITLAADREEMINALKALDTHLLWLSSWMIHNANHIRPKVDGIKIGGHQASSASMVSILTALYFTALRPQDRVAVKPHASPVHGGRLRTSFVADHSGRRGRFGCRK